MKRVLFCIAISGTFLCLLFSYTHMEPASVVQADAFSFIVQSPTGNHPEQISVWHDTDKLYVFLPAYASLDHTFIQVSQGYSVSLNHQPLQSREHCGTYAFETDYPVEINGVPSGTLRFCHSENVPAMYIDTITGSMDAIHENKYQSEYARISLYDAYGMPDYQGSFYDRIRGRGNTSWWESEKKPYYLYLNHPASLLQMDSVQKWTLIANDLDPTNLRNKLIYDFARTVASYEGFAPRCTFVDLYLNHEYAGLYLLCEKPEFTPGFYRNNHVQVLVDTDLYDRSGALSNAFFLNIGIAAEVKYPDSPSTSLIHSIQSRFTAFQDALTDVSSDDAWESYIDISSWARRYLIEEIFENYDAGACSQFYFLNGMDNRLYSGPCWDYDNTLGIGLQKNPCCFLAQREWKNDDTYTPWYAALWQKACFRNEVLRLFRKEFLPGLQALLNDGIFSEAAVIEKASEMNALRWYNGRDITADIREMHAFLKDRLDFLKSAWIDGVEYKTIALTGIEEYLYFSVPVGTVCPSLPTPASLNAYGINQWTRLDNGELFDPNTIITEDLVLTARMPVYDDDISDSSTAILSRTQAVLIASLFVFILVLLCLILTDHTRQKGFQKK